MISTGVATAGGNKVMGQSLIGVTRCPHCGIASPSLTCEWASNGPMRGSDASKGGSWWGAYKCTTCGDITTASGQYAGNHFGVFGLFPSPRRAHEDLPEPARTFLQQAYETLHAPDAAALMAGSAVDGMLKHHGYSNGSLYSRIDEALAANLLTQGMAKWAHSVRLEANRPRHADKEQPHVSPEEAKQSVEFAEALGNFLFVLTAKISRGIEAAKKASIFD